MFTVRDRLSEEKGDQVQPSYKSYKSCAVPRFAVHVLPTGTMTKSTNKQSRAIQNPLTAQTIGIQGVCGMLTSYTLH